MNYLIIEDMADKNWGGAEASMFDYACHLKQHGHYVFFTWSRKGDWLEHITENPFSEGIYIKLDSIKQQGVLSFISNLIRFRKFCKLNQINILMTHTIHGFFFLRCAVLFTGLPLFVYFKWVSNFPDIGMLNKWGTKSITMAIASTSFVQKYWISNKVNPKKGFHIIPDGINIPIIFYKKDYTKNIINLLFLGRIYEGKGLHLILDVLTFFPDMHLNIAGYFEVTDNHEFINYHKLLHHKITVNKITDRVHFLGKIDNPHEIISLADLVIVPSICAEAQSRVVLEAMALKTLVIASNIGGIPEVLGQEGSIMLFEPDINSLKNKISYIVNMSAIEKSTIAENLKIRFGSKYTIEATHKELDKLIIQLVN